MTSRSRVVAKELKEVAKFSYWPPVVGAVSAVVFPYGWVWLCAGLLAFGYGIRRSRQRRDAKHAELEIQTAKMRSAHAAEGTSLAETLAKAAAGEGDAVRLLLARWKHRCGDTLNGLAIEVQRLPDGAFAIGGRGRDRGNISPTTSRSGRGGRTFHDKRKASEIDSELAEWNAGAVLTAVFALFGGPTKQRVAVRCTIEDAAGDRIPWITLASELDGRIVSEAIARGGLPTEAWRQLGGDVGRCRNQRYMPAQEPAWRQTTDSPVRLSGSSSEGAAGSAGALPSLTPNTFPDRGDYFGNRSRKRLADRATGVVFGETQSAVGGMQRVPSAPPGFTPSVTISVSMNEIGSDFAADAKKRASIVGDPSAPFVPFQAYWSTYASMNDAQTKFYFRWRSAVRGGQFMPTDLSYLFIHVYELLHLVGARDAIDAAAQLTRLWQGYRSTYPKLDSYLVPWITDLYAIEINVESAYAFLKKHIDIRTPQCDDLFVTVDSHWSAGDFDAMTPAGLAMLLAERRLGDNKFVREHNTEIDGRPWVEGAYRTAIQTADSLFKESSGRTLREATIKKTGTRVVSREAFAGAVYSWKRKAVKLGKVPSLSEQSPSVTLYRSVARHAENLLRKERGFQGRLRGVELSPELALAVEESITGYLRATKPRTRVTIDVVKAEQLARESVDTRARLLEGLDEYQAPDASPAAARTDGLLTDVQAVASIMSALSESAVRMVGVLVDSDWELHRDDRALLAAVGGVLIDPLVDEINGYSTHSLGVALVVREADRLVVQEDYRDEVYYIVRGNLDGFIAEAGTKAAPATSDDAPSILQSFGPVELQTLVAIAGGAADGAQVLAALAVAHTATPLLLIDRLNECAVDSTYGDILVDVDADPPVILVDAVEIVDEVLRHVRRYSNELA
jgi:hypothetical protein